MKKLTAILMTLLLLCGSFAIFPVSAEKDKIVFLPTQTVDYTDGGWWIASGGIPAAESYGDEGLDITAPFRTVWSFHDSVANKYPYLIIEVESGMENLSRFTATHLWHTSIESSQVDIDISTADQGAICINMLEFLKHEEGTDGFLYLVPYIEGRVVFKKLYISNTDLDGNVYVPPTQPNPLESTGLMLRYNLPAYADGNHITPIAGSDYGYGWLMTQPDGSIPVQITEHEDGKGFRMERKEGFEGWTAANVAWVVPYEQLEETPYLIFDIANQGRPDEGPQVNIYAYWEGVTGSLARFDGLETAVGANGLHGVNAFNLKYAVDNVEKDLHGDYGIAIVVALDWSKAGTDGTCLEPLEMNDIYLAGVKEGFTTRITATTTTVTTATTTASDGDAVEGGEFPILPVAIAAAAVIVVAAVVVIVLKKKK